MRQLQYVLDDTVAVGRYQSGAARSNTPVAAYRSAGKRALDLILSVPLLPVVALIVLGVVVYMRLSGDRGPAFFGHLRVGRGGKVFRCWKIRTMVVDAEARLRDELANNPEAAAEWARDHKLTNDPRVTQFGGFLRRTSLDELPQLWNVIKGDMSLVGPRPVVRTELHKYGQHRATYTKVRPGITGLWQVTGRNDISYDKRVQLDAAYVQKLSLVLDVLVLIGTFSAVLGRTGK